MTKLFFASRIYRYMVILNRVKNIKILYKEKRETKEKGEIK